MIKYGIIATTGGVLAHYVYNLSEKSSKLTKNYQDKKSEFLSNPNFGLLYNPFAYFYSYNKSDDIKSLKEY
jgi:hypothetical protein